MTTHRLTVGDRAPLFELPDTDGTPVRLIPERHPASVVVFTANGCPYARAWHDRIQAVARDYAGRGVAVLQVVSNDDADHPEDAVEAMARRVAAGELAGPFLRDAEQSAARAYGATATPEVFVIDRAGVVRYHGAPDGDHDDPAQDARWLRDALDDVLADRPVARPPTSPAGCSIKWRVELLWWEGCPTHGQAADVLRDARRAGPWRGARRRARGAHPRRGRSGSASPARRRSRSAGVDLFPTDAPPALTCRVYTRGDGRMSPLPDRDALAARLREALARPWDLPHWVDPRNTRRSRRGPHDHVNARSAASASTPSRRSTSCARCPSRTASRAAGESAPAGSRSSRSSRSPAYPHLTDEFVDDWFGWMEQVRDDPGRHRPVPRHQAATRTAG